MTGIDRIAVVIPAHNEVETLPGCLASIDRARLALPARVRVDILVVLDRCTDDTAKVAAANGISTVTTTGRNVGIARATGAAELLGAAPAAGTWLVTTDADSRVPPDWFGTQLRAARAGWDAYVGTIVVDDWSAHPPQVRRRFHARYPRAADGPHVHGANLGVRATAYQRAGGFPPLATGEDRALVTALVRSGASVCYRDDSPVLTSARPSGRAPQGFAAYLLLLR